MDPGEKLTPDAVKTASISCLFCFFSGFLYSLGVFSPSIEASATPPGSLDGVWSSGMALLSAFSIPAMFFTGVYLSPDSGSADCSGEKTSRGRIVAAAGSIGYAMLAIGGYGVAINSPFLIRVSFVSVGAGFGLLFLQSMELLAAWVPHRPGIAVGIGQMTYGIGSIFGSSIFNYLLQNHTTPHALYIAAAIMSMPTAAVSPFIKWPSQSLIRHDGSESDPLVKQISPLSLKELSYLPSFWMYSFTIFSLRSGMAFVAYFFKIGHTFGKGVSEVITSFQVATVAGTLSRPLTGALADNLKTVAGFFSVGSKNVIIILLTAQSASFLGLMAVSAQRWYAGFAVFAGVVQVVFAAGTCCVPLLARELFGAVNSGVVFGTGGSIAAGLGEIVAVWMMAVVESYAGSDASPAAYQAYYAISFLWSVSGLVVCVMLTAQRRGYSRGKSMEEAKPRYDEIAPSA